MKSQVMPQVIYAFCCGCGKDAPLRQISLDRWRCIECAQKEFHGEYPHFSNKKGEAE